MCVLTPCVLERGEPLANYRQVKAAIERIQSDLGIGARKITVSTVGIVPNIRKLMVDLPQVRLAVSLHCASDEERSALLPANERYGGLDELMTCLQEYITTTGRRITLEWALIEGQNDTPETARQLGKLIAKYGLRRDMVHINVIPLNPTGGFEGSPSQRGRVNAFCQILEQDFGVACTPRVRRGIDIDAGCGQLKAKVMREGKDDARSEEDVASSGASVAETFVIDDAAVDFESDDYDDPEFDHQWQKDEAARLISLVQGTTVPSKVLLDETKPINRKKSRGTNALAP